MTNPADTMKDDAQKKQQAQERLDNVRDVLNNIFVSDNESIMFGPKMERSNFDVMNENFARDLSRQLTRNIHSGYLGYCGRGQQNCAGSGTGTFNQISKKYDDAFNLGVKGTWCPDVRAKYAKLYGSDGSTKNCYATLKEKIDANPTVPQVFTLTVKSPKSNSGLHYLTVAPKIDSKGEIVRDSSGAVQYCAYGFNQNRIIDIDKYSMLKREGNVFPITEIAQRRAAERGIDASLGIQDVGTGNEVAAARSSTSGNNGIVNVGDVIESVAKNDKENTDFDTAICCMLLKLAFGGRE